MCCQRAIYTPTAYAAHCAREKAAQKSDGQRGERELKQAADADYITLSAANLD